MRDVDFFLTRYAPVTTHLAFVKTPAAEFAQVLLKWTEDVNAMFSLPWQVTSQPVRGKLSDKLAALLPLTSPDTKQLVSTTKSDWTAYIPNGARGGDVHAPVSYMTKQLRVLSVTVVLVEDVPKGQPGSVQFALEDWRSGKVVSRSIAAHKETRWEFIEYGERLPFEEPENYRAKRIKDRLTTRLVERYCGNLGIELFDPAFYEGDGYVIHKYPPPNTVFCAEYPNQKSRIGPS